MHRAIMIHLFLCWILFDGPVHGAMTEKQLGATIKLVRNMCQPKNKATNEDIDKMHAGDWNVDQTAKCYMHCALQTQKLMTKDNTLDIDLAITLAQKTLPDGRRAGALESIDKCKDSIKTLDDKCAAAYEISKCFYESNPSNYFLP